MLLTEVPMTAGKFRQRCRSAQLKVVSRTLSSMRLLLCMVKRSFLAASILGFGLATAFGQAVGNPPVADGKTNPVISLDDAIHRALANEPAFAAAVAGRRVARLD